MAFRKPNWGPPPEGYVAGLGRGATGFVTRADYGPAKVEGQAHDIALMQLVYRPQAGVMGPPGVKISATGALRELTGMGRGGIPAANAQPEREDFSESNFDEWSGYGGGTLASGSNDAEDNEADSVFEKVEEFMDGRRKKKREEKLKEAESQIAKEKQKKLDYQMQFQDLKRHLASVSRNEWESLPDAPDLVKLSKKQREQAQPQRFMPVPDSVINSARLDSRPTTFIDPTQNGINSTYNGSTSGFESSMNNGMMSVGGTNLTELGQARGQLLQIKLDKASSESVIARTPSVNKDGYMTDLNSLTFNSAHEINDIKKARALLKSVITSNPNSASGWIAAARVEELDGKIQQARNILAQACQNFLNNEDIWFEAARLSPPDKTKALLTKAVSLMPKSKKLWLQASRKEQDLTIRKQVLIKALEQLPSDLELWKETIQLAQPEEAKALLYKATEAIPDSTELWLALAKLETYENARTVLNKAREHLPTDHTIWIAAAKLEEAQGNTPQVEKIVARAIKKISTHGVKVKRDQWLKEAVQAEESGSVVTCRALIKETMQYGMEEYLEGGLALAAESDKERVKVVKRIWIENAEACAQQNAIETARAIYFNAIRLHPTKKSLWFNAIKLEEQYGGKDNLTDILSRAKDSTHHVFFYLKLAKNLWKQHGDAESTRKILLEGYQNNPMSEEMVLAIQKFERENQNYSQAEKILEQARQQIPSEKVHMQSVQLQREVKNIDTALLLVNEGLASYRTFYKLWLIKAQILEQINHLEEARATYEEALTVDKVKLERQIWISYSEFETKQEAYTRARTILQKARIRMPNDEHIWLASIRLEIKTENFKISLNLLSQALQKCPTSGKLWAQQIEMEPASTRKAQVMNALKANDSDSDLFLAIAKVFWVERKAEKIRKWLKNAVTVNKDNGDAWAHLLRYEMEFGTEETQKEVLQEFREADPHHGEMWAREAKKVENWRKDPNVILKNVARSIKLFEEV